MIVVPSLLLAVLFGSCANAFHLSTQTRPRVSSLKMAILDDGSWAGQSAPFGFFDPLGFSKSVSDKEAKRWRESELKHGRLAMIAALAIPFSENWHPFYPNIEGPAIHHFEQIGQIWTWFWLVPFFWTGFFEALSINKGWSEGQVKLDYIPGDLNFDPLGLGVDPGSFENMSEEFKTKRTKELNNGRLAMLAVAGFVAQELVDGLPVVEHLRTFGLSRGF